MRSTSPSRSVKVDAEVIVFFHFNSSFKSLYLPTNIKQISLNWVENATIGHFYVAKQKAWKHSGPIQNWNVLTSPIGQVV